jgi:hypothetical protein
MALDRYQREHLAASFGKLANWLFFALLLALSIADPAAPWLVALFGVVSYVGLTIFSLWLLKGTHGKD